MVGLVTPSQTQNRSGERARDSLALSVVAYLESRARRLGPPNYGMIRDSFGTVG